jgi:hypothetical protein
VKRVRLPIALSIAALSLGLTCALLSAHNRARAGELDEAQRRYEIELREAQLLRAGLEGAEWRLLSGRWAEGTPAPEVER